jgi:hypothetical protein
MKRAHGLTVAERLARYRKVSGECWETLLDPRHKYPQVKLEGRKVMVHRAAYEALVGAIPVGMSVLHRCDNPRCHRPEHLFLGTLSDNMKDMVAKGRNNPAGPKHDHASIIALAHLSQKEIAQLLGISQPCVSQVLRKHGLSRGRQTLFGKGHGRGGWPKGTKRQFPSGPKQK